ncbi:MAG: aspartyl-tRNA(Asn)/glutamyl-tRNA(Gln) amidotransferase subunit [Methanobacteriaceae archaeon]|nr:aspartyl-tRNA(Asn)/glutamyl-tRNA(Gln) amidotransferase subunit [Methanobacteriaceae archaeon]
MDTRSKVEAIKGHELTAEENVKNFLETIEKENPRINAFIEVNKEYAIRKAAEIDSRISADEKVGRLAGLVIGVKSNINVKDFMVSAASKTLENYRGSYDATVIERIKKEDGIIIGMTNMDEFAAGSSTETSYFGVTDNPSAEGRIPGGSSGGSAAAIAAHMCDLTLGSDTGGSIRNPASHCGVYGFKPTYGLVSRQGLLDLAMSFDQIGPLSNDLYGISLLLDVISGYDPKDPTTIKSEGTSFTELSDERGPDLTFGVVKEFQEVTDDPIVDIIEDTINLLREEGYDVVELPFKYIDLCLPTYYLINYVEFFSATRKYDGRKYGYKIEDVCGEEVLRRIQIGSYISQKEFSGRYYRRALQARSLIRKEIEKVLKNVDVILGPTVPKLPHKIGTTLTPMEMYSYDILTVIANLAGIPAASMKIGKVKGIPIGLQLQAKPLEDWKIMKTMLEIGSILEGRG